MAKHLFGLGELRDKLGLHLRPGWREGASVSTLSDKLRRDGNASELRIGRVQLARAAETQHVLLAGDGCTDRIWAMCELLDGVRARGDMAIVYDSSARLLPIYYRPEAGDRILNPLDRRSETWSPWAEFTGERSADRLAAALIPPGSGMTTAFSHAARANFSSVLRMLDAVPGHTAADLVHLLRLSWSAAQETLFADPAMARLLETYPGQAATALRVQAECYLESLEFLKADAGTADFSISAFVGRADAPSDPAAPYPWLFVTAPPSHQMALQPLLTCMMDTAMDAALALPENAQRRIWLFFDDIGSLNDMPSLHSVLREGRKFGICVVAGLQDFSCLTEFSGDEATRNLSRLFESFAIFRLSDRLAAEQAAMLLAAAGLGDTQTGLDEWGTNVRFDTLSSRVRQGDYWRHLERHLLASGIMELASLVCYQLRPGSSAVELTRLARPDATARPMRHAALEVADLSQTVLAQRRADGSPKDSGGWLDVRGPGKPQ